ncbi:MAG: serine/threonine-protein kinase [Kofleriaceae bacterium]
MALDASPKKTSAAPSRPRNGTSGDDPTLVGCPQQIAALAAAMNEVDVEATRARHAPASESAGVAPPRANRVNAARAPTRRRSTLREHQQSQTHAHPLPLVRAPRLGRYGLVRLLGSGSTCHVYLGRPQEPADVTRHFAIKILRREHESDAATISAFTEQARTFARLSHVAIARVGALGHQDGSYYLVMEYLRGMSLRALLQRSPRGLPIGFAISAAVSCAEALHHARATLLADRPGALGISPAHVMACGDGSIKVCKLRVTKEPRLVTGVDSPEQARGEVLDRRSDAFSLGVMLYQLVTGVHPFLDPASEPASRDARDRLLHAAIRPPAQRAPKVPAELSAVIMNALARDPQRRYRGCGELAQALIKVAERVGARVGPASLWKLVNQLSDEVDPTTRTARARRAATSPGVGAILPPPPPPKRPTTRPTTRQPTKGGIPKEPEARSPPNTDELGTPRKASRADGSTASLPASDLPTASLWIIGPVWTRAPVASTRGPRTLARGTERLPLRDVASANALGARHAAERAAGPSERSGGSALATTAAPSGTSVAAARPWLRTALALLAMLGAVSLLALVAR